LDGLLDVVADVTITKSITELIGRAFWTVNVQVFHV
jgi:hypothetical protein